MSDKLLVSMWGLTINANGVVAIGATLIIVVVLAVAMRRRMMWPDGSRQWGAIAKRIAPPLAPERSERRFAIPRYVLDCTVDIR
jgi:hypothetical protein